MSDSRPSRLDDALKLFAIAPLALILTCPVTVVLTAVLAEGIWEPPPKQFFMRWPLDEMLRGLALLLPWLTGVAVVFWGLKPKRSWGKLSLGILLAGWLAFVGLCNLDRRWGCIDTPPDGSIYLCNETTHRVAYTTQPAVDDSRARELWRWDRHIEAGRARRLTQLPADGWLRIEAMDDAGQSIFCRQYAPEDIRALQGRVRIFDGTLQCQ